uniref:Uncharacterized protein n=1 Tax=Larimichthys crocea TaxID=215358 RepID=A0A0F8AK52_LARCR
MKSLDRTLIRTVDRTLEGWPVISVIGSTCCCSYKAGHHVGHQNQVNAAESGSDPGADPGLPHPALQSSPLPLSPSPSELTGPDRTSVRPR